MPASLPACGAPRPAPRRATPLPPPITPVPPSATPPFISMPFSRYPFGGRLTHEVPLWVHPEHHQFHIRIRQEPCDPTPLTEPHRAKALLRSAEFYHQQGRWGLSLFLLRPDHLHALLDLPPDRALGKPLGKWKGFHKRTQGVCWQRGFFDHRLRSERSKSEKWGYIRGNPVASGLCDSPGDWPWWIEVHADGERRSGCNLAHE